MLNADNLDTSVGRLLNINPWRAGNELIRFNIANVMVADSLAPFVARTSAPMVFVMCHSSCLTWGRISTTHVMSVEEWYKLLIHFMLHMENVARKALIIRGLLLIMPDYQDNQQKSFASLHAYVQIAIRFRVFITSRTHAEIYFSL